MLASASDPIDEIANRSGLPASEVSAILSNCEANQTSMNFCAWRDQLVAEQKLEHVVEATAGSSTACKTALQKKIAAWKKRRDANCSKSASREWGNGSMLPTAVAMCKTAATDRMRKAIGTEKCR
ncbi:lysozyme inhibitor LprI family protein [Paraburkholderia sp.]|uniref:lysozyme inhibitor LprI family protein n=1 Tax=Paraburkholderia sp. TaxID=1926495 RepID=UPI0039E65075